MTGILSLELIAGMHELPPAERVQRETYAEFQADLAEDIRLRRRQQADDDAAEIEALTLGTLEKLYATELAEVTTLEPATVKTYTKEFALYRKWVEGVGLPALPTLPGAVASYLHCLREEGASYWRLRVVKASIRRASLFHGKADPTESDLAFAVLARARKAQGDHHDQEANSNAEIETADEQE